MLQQDISIIILTADGDVRYFCSSLLHFKKIGMAYSTKETKPSSHSGQVISQLERPVKLMSQLHDANVISEAQGSPKAGRIQGEFTCIS